MRMMIAAGFLVAGVLSDHGATPPFIDWVGRPAEPVPLLEHRTYRSAAMSCDVGYGIYLPPGYRDDAGQRFPVIYWLHDRPDGPRCDRFPLPFIDEAIRKRFLPPVIVVFTCAGSKGFYSDSQDSRWLAETTLIRELIPHIDSTFRTHATQDSRAIHGTGIGGFGALKLALEYPDHFSSAVSIAGAFPDPAAIQEGNHAECFRTIFDGDAAYFLANHPASLAKANAAPVTAAKLAIRLRVGTAHSEIASNRALRRTLEEAGLAVDYLEFADLGDDPERLFDCLGIDDLEFSVGHFGLCRAADRDGPWVNPPRQPVPGCEHHLFFSHAMQRAVGYNIYLPPGYRDCPGIRFPVVYWLHGMSDSESTHLGIAAHLDHAIRAGQVEPMIVVAAYGGRHSWFADYADGTVLAESVIVDDLIPHIDSRWRTLADREHRGIEGFSMGAAAALRLAAKYGDLFSSAVLVSGGFRTLEEMKSQHPTQFVRIWGGDQACAADLPWTVVERHADALRSQVSVRQVVGAEDFLLDANRRMRDRFTELGIVVDYEEIAGLGHDPRAVYSRAGVTGWRFHAARFAR